MLRNYDSTQRQNWSRYRRTYSTCISKVFFLLLQVGGAVSSTVVDTKHTASSAPESVFETPCLLNFSHLCKEILGKMKGLLEKHLSNSKEYFKFDKDTFGGSNDEEEILTESDQDDEEKNSRK